MAVTLLEVARRAGVSKTAASLVLADRALEARLSDQTCRAVRAAAAELGYYPNPHARALRGGKTNLVAVAVRVAGSSAQGIVPLLLAALHEALARRGFAAQVTAGGWDDLGILRTLLQSLHRVRPDGLLFVSWSPAPEEVDDLLWEAGPCVAVGARPSHPAAAWADIDREAAFALLTDQLVRLGHRDIAIASSAKRKIAGWRRAMLLAGLEPGEPLPLPAGLSSQLQIGYAYGTALLARRPRPTAVIASDDERALGIMRRLQEAGLRVPQDLSVAGFDDLGFAAYLTPALTTVAYNVAELSEQAVELLLRQAGGDRTRRSVLVLPRLVVRESTAAPGHPPERMTTDAAPTVARDRRP